MPFELLGLVDWLIHRYALSEETALAWASQAAQRPVPATRAALYDCGLPSVALSAEMRRARAAGVTSLWAGIELVEIPDVCHLETAQIERDFNAIDAGSVDGLVLS